MNYWAEQEENKNPNAILEKLYPQIIERIRFYEQFLSDWGIIAQAGIEQEFLAVHAKDSKGETLHNINMRDTYFINSPFIEAVKTDHSQDFSISDYMSFNGYEVLVGRGNLAKKKDYPQDSLQPIVIARVSEKTNQIINQQANNYNLTEVSFDPTKQGLRLYSQQICMSLWDKNKKTPLFDEKGMNNLSKICIKNLLEAQNALVILYTINNNSFARFNDKISYLNFKNISFARAKISNPSVLYRMKGDYNQFSETQFGGYIENRLGSSDMSPYVNMLITLSGIANGVKEYIANNNIRSKEDLAEFLKEDEYVVNMPRAGNNSEIESIEKGMPSYKLPKDKNHSLRRTNNNKRLAKEILGDELYKSITKVYQTNISI